MAETAPLVLVAEMRVTEPGIGVFCPRCCHHIPHETAEAHFAAGTCTRLEVRIAAYLDSLPKVACPCGCGEMLDSSTAEDVELCGHYWK